MRLRSKRQRFELAMTLAELCVAMGIGSAILAAFTYAGVGLQKSFVAIEDYSKGLNDQMRISDYLSLDLRRAYDIQLAKDTTTGMVTVTLTIPNFYKPVDANTDAGMPYDPQIIGVLGWPYKKKRHHHNKHQNIILTEDLNYGPYNGTTVTAPYQTVVYAFNNSTARLYRCVDGAVPPATVSAIDPTGVTTIASDVQDFNVTIGALDEIATTSITFRPRFNFLKPFLSGAAQSDAEVGTKYFQTTLTRNTGLLRTVP
jgi:hypothetical protein